jgi:hypothetical protein
MARAAQVVREEVEEAELEDAVGVEAGADTCAGEDSAGAEPCRPAATRTTSFL